jgi:hypothetical protein
MALINKMFRPVFAGKKYFEKYILDIPELTPAQKLKVKAALKRAFEAGADYGVKIASASAEGAGKGIVEGFKK